MVNGEWIMVNDEWCDVTGLLIKSRTRIEQFPLRRGLPHLAKAKHRREMSIESEDHNSTDGVGKTHFPLRREPRCVAKAKRRRGMLMGSEDHNSTDGTGKTHIPLRRGTAVRSEGEAPQGDVAGVNEELAEEPHQHPPPSLALGHPCTVCGISTNIPRPR